MRKFKSIKLRLKILIKISQTNCNFLPKIHPQPDARLDSASCRSKECGGGRLYVWEYWETFALLRGFMAQHIESERSSKLNESAHVSQETVNGIVQCRCALNILSCHARHQPKNLWMNFLNFPFFASPRFPSMATIASSQHIDLNALHTERKKV